MFTIEQARDVLGAQPFSRLLGTELTGLTEDSVRLSLPVRDDLLQQYGYVHGGVLSYLADNALTYAAALGLGSDIVTSGFGIEYVAPARDGHMLHADAQLVRHGRSKAVARCDISLMTEDGQRLVAVAQGTSMVRNRGPQTSL